MSYCPHCGNILYDNSSFCAYCGKAIITNRTVSEEPVVTYKEVPVATRVVYVPDESSQSPKKILKRIADLKKRGQIDQAIQYCDVFLDVDPNCVDIRNQRTALLQTITEPNVTIRFNASKWVELQTSIDNRQITRYEKGDQKVFKVETGNHIVKFNIGAKKYSRAIEIKDRYTQIIISVAAGKMRNSIVIQNGKLTML